MRRSSPNTWSSRSLDGIIVKASSRITEDVTITCSDFDCWYGASIACGVGWELIISGSIVFRKILSPSKTSCPRTFCNRTVSTTTCNYELELWVAAVLNCNVSTLDVYSKPKVYCLLCRGGSCDGEVICWCGEWHCGMGCRHGTIFVYMVASHCTTSSIIRCKVINVIWKSAWIACFCSESIGINRVAWLGRICECDIGSCTWWTYDWYVDILCIDQVAVGHVAAETHSLISVRSNIGICV